MQQVQSMQDERMSNVWTDASQTASPTPRRASRTVRSAWRVFSETEPEPWERLRPEPSEDDETDPEPEPEPQERLRPEPSEDDETEPEPRQMHIPRGRFSALCASILAATRAGCRQLEI